MRPAALLIMTILLLSIASAEVSIISTGEQAQEAEPLLEVQAQGRSIVITPTADVAEAYVYLDQELIMTYEDLTAGAAVTITTDETGEHDVEVRSARTYTYEWESGDVVKDDHPITFSYAKYDKDDKKIEFSLGHPGIIHPEHLGRTTDSAAASYREFTATVNDGTSVNCYPRITTGKNLFFSCYSASYVRQVTLEALIGLKETTTVTLQGGTQEEALVPPPPPPPPPSRGTATTTAQTGQEESGEEQEALPLEEEITMTDTYTDNAAPIPVTVFVILMFLSFMTILFVASHHNYESKQAGTHHPLKKKK